MRWGNVHFVTLLIILVLAISIAGYGIDGGKQLRSQFELLSSAQTSIGPEDVLLYNSAPDTVQLNLRSASKETAPWQSFTLAPEETRVFTGATFISLVTALPDGSIHDAQYKLDFGVRYAVYWNKTHWDMVQVVDEPRFGR